MAKPAQTFTIADLRGGINNSDSPTLIADNQVVDARNVDFRDGALGSKRRGTEGVDITSAIFNSPIVALIRHTPTNSIGADELWGIDENGNIDRRVGGTWQGGVARVNDYVTLRANNFSANGSSLHGKLFIAAQGDEDRLLVWDGSVLRWAGLAQPPDPTVANTAVAGSYSGTRYFRIRYTEQVSGVTVRRSEPTNTVSLAPTGAFTGAVVTKPAGTEATTSVYCEGQTHWEVEASIDNILFYRIATVAIGTSTYTDTTAYATGYSTNTLSEQIGEYIPPISARHVAVDEDRLVVAGSFFTDGLDARVSWTPVGADDGTGNDERVPTTTLNYITFDGLDGGRITALTAGVSGNVYVFKSSRIYKMVRTGIVQSAYQPIAESFSRGALARASVGGNDKAGVPCVYFLDPSVGLCRIGQRGIEDLAQGIRDTWRGRNPEPAIEPRILYYPALDQVWYTSPLDNADVIQTVVPETILTAAGDEIKAAQTRPGLLVDFEVRYDSVMLHDGLLGGAQALALAPRDTGLVPVLGTESEPVGAGNFSTIHYADVGTSDGGTAFRAYVKTKPYTLGGLWSKFGLMAAVLLSRAAAGTSIAIGMIRNFGVETRTVSVDISPAASESHVIKPVDNASMSELNTVQLEYGDATASEQEWSLDQFTFKIRPEEGSAG
jgi:hypothetical protein